MPRRTKIYLVAVIVLLGTGAALVFRKPAAVETEEATTAATALPPVPAGPLVPKPAPISHLTGSIDPADKAVGSMMPTAADRRDQPPFSFTSGGSEPGGYSTLGAAGEPSATQPLGSVGAPPSATPGVNEMRRHKIVDGDTLSALAIRYLGTADRYREIFELNKDVLASPDLLPIGKTIRIPGTTLAAPPQVGSGARPMVPVAPRQPSDPG